METVVLGLFVSAMVTLAGGLWRLQQEGVLQSSAARREPNRKPLRNVQPLAASDLC